ncbi:DUF1579 family protein [Emticicia sp. C21]|uniref:DUF1579 family protein n=1 Tax=Emticicia sp. C21 TaxID=2302915 RepID=UPI000E3430E5|nr:DUF1579 family protein [Emticicia sp. C21]RFS17719.1 DUF1579 domain-containing protein [Emticicia sp. C21]
METQEIAHNHLDKFVGKWNTQGLVLPTNTSAGIEVKGSDTYEWLPGGYFLLHKVDVSIGDDKVQTFEVIGLDKDANHYTMQHYDNKGNSGSMTATLADDLWIFKGESLLFKGRFSEEDTVFSGVWEQLNKEKVWTPYMNIKLSRDLS